MNTRKIERMVSRKSLNWEEEVVMRTKKRKGEDRKNQRDAQREIYHEL